MENFHLTKTMNTDNKTKREKEKYLKRNGSIWYVLLIYGRQLVLFFSNHVKMRFLCLLIYIYTLHDANALSIYFMTKRMQKRAFFIIRIGDLWKHCFSFIFSLSSKYRDRNWMRKKKLKKHNFNFKIKQALS